MSRSNVGRLIGLATLALALVVLPGCLKQKVDVVVTKSGAGTATLTMTFNLEKLEQMKEMMKGMMGGAEDGEGDDPMKEADPEQMKKILEGNAHVRIVSADRKRSEDGKSETTAVKVEFDSLKDLYESGLISGVNAKLEKLEDGNYRWTANAVMGSGEEPSSEELEQQGAMMMAMFEPFLGDMELSGKMTLPTSVVETNGTKGEANDVSWQMGFKDLLKADKRKQAVVFKGEGLDWKPFEVKASDVEAKRAKLLGEDEDEEGAEEDEGAEVEEPAMR